MKGSVSKRGKRSWRIRFDVDRVGGRRKVHYSTIRGTRKDAEAELARLVHEANTGTRVEPAKLTVAEYLLSWIDGRSDVAPLTRQKYRDIIERQTIPHIGAIPIQKLKPLQIKNWLTQVRAAGRHGRPLSDTSVGNVFRCVSSALQDAVELEVISRNPCAPARPQRGESAEVDILTAEEIMRLLVHLRGSPYFTITSLALASGMRRGELLGLRWSDVAGNRIHITRSLEQTRLGLRFKKPKGGKSRAVPIPDEAVNHLRSHRARQLELRLQLGMGKPAPDALVFSDLDGAPIKPNSFSVTWKRAANAVTKSTFHITRHTYASILIADGVDVVRVSKLLGHHSPAFTLRTYAHLFERAESGAAVGNTLGKLIGGPSVGN
jgi:integrase